MYLNIWLAICCQSNLCVFSHFILIMLDWYYHSHCKREKTEASDRLRSFNQEGSTVWRRELFSVRWQPGWEGSLGENGYMCMYGWGPLLSIWNHHNTVNWLHSKTKQKLNKINVKTHKWSWETEHFEWHGKCEDFLKSYSLSSALLLLLLLRRFSRVRLCATPQTGAHQAPLSLGFSRQEHWSGLPFPSPMQESEMWKGSRSVVSSSPWPYGL